MVLDEPKGGAPSPNASLKPANETRAGAKNTAAKQSIIYLDGQFLPESEAKVSVFDHGLLYGDGIFEGIRFYNGRVFRLEEHLDRLWDSARSICLEIPMSKEEMTKALLETIRRNGMQDGYIRQIVTRGVGNLGLNPLQCKKPSVIIIVAKIALYPEEVYRHGLTVITCATRRMNAAALNPAIKSLNYLNNILAKIEANNGGCEEAVMLNSEGYVAEATADNIFIVRGNELLTPPLSAGALYGITRGVVMGLARESGLAVSEPNLTRYDLFNADECFLTGTGAELIPVVKIDGRIIGSGKPGARTKELVTKYHALTKESGEPI